MMLSRRAPRSGLSLLEVLIALAVFLFSYVAIWQLMNLANDRATDLAYRNLATQLAQSTLAEIAAGSQPLQAQGDTPVGDNAPDFTYSVEINSGPVDSVKSVAVTVTHESKGRTMQVKITQMMLDPSTVGSTQDVQTVTGTDPSASAPSGTSGTSSSGSSAAPAKPATSTPAKGG